MPDTIPVPLTPDGSRPALSFVHDGTPYLCIAAEAVADVDPATEIYWEADERRTFRLTTPLPGLGFPQTMRLQGYHDATNDALLLTSRVRGVPVSAAVRMKELVAALAHAHASMARIASRRLALVGTVTA